MLVCLLWALAVPAGARAAAAFGDTTCAVQSVTIGATTTWQIKGTTSVTGLIPGGNGVTVTVEFQKMAKGAPGWSKMLKVKQEIDGLGGKATIDTGFNDFTAAPASGDQYRIHVTGANRTAPLPKNNPLNPVDSTPITPIP
jgi:hypothetical protein